MSDNLKTDIKIVNTFENPLVTATKVHSSHSTHSFFSPFYYAKGIEDNKLIIAHEVPLEVLLKEKSSDIRELNANETKEKQEKLEEERTEKIDINEKAEELIGHAEEMETVLSELDGILVVLVTKIEEKGGLKYPVSYVVTRYLDSADVKEKADRLKERLEEEISGFEKEGKEIKVKEIADDLNEIIEGAERLNPKDAIIGEIEEGLKERIEEAEPELKDRIASKAGSAAVEISSLEEINVKEGEELLGKAFTDERKERIEKLIEAHDAKISKLKEIKNAILDAQILVLNS